jgi:hypothetical protein
MLHPPLKLDISLPAREDTPIADSTNYPGPDSGFSLPKIKNLEVENLKKKFKKYPDQKLQIFLSKP